MVMLIDGSAFTKMTLSLMSRSSGSYPGKRAGKLPLWVLPVGLVAASSIRASAFSPHGERQSR